MEESKVLFQVTNEGGGISVQCHTDSEKEVFQVALAIHRLVSNSPLISVMLANIIEMEMKDPHFSEVLDNATIKMPDFESILKNDK